MPKKFETLRGKMHRRAQERSRSLANAFREDLMPRLGGTTDNSAPALPAGKPKREWKVTEALRILDNAESEEPHEGDELG